MLVVSGIAALAMSGALILRADADDDEDEENERDLSVAAVRSTPSQTPLRQRA